MLSRSFAQNKLQWNQLEHKQLHPQIHFATPTHDKQFKPVHYVVEHETVLPSQKDLCKPILADFRKDRFCIRTQDKGENIIKKHLD